MKKKFLYGSKTVEVDVVEQERHTLRLMVHPDLKVVASVPAGKSHEEVENRIARKLPWIVRQLNFFDKFHPLQPPREYVSGETHYYLGRQYRLKIRKGDESSVKLIGKFFEVVTPTPSDSTKVRKILHSWYRTHAIDLFERKIGEHYPFFKRRGAAHPKLITRTMQKRWGSCTGKGTITLNTDLVRAPLVCIDYVIIHELCHLIQPNHDKKFYRLVSAAMPDWEKWKDRLERTVLG